MTFRIEQSPVGLHEDLAKVWFLVKKKGGFTILIVVVALVVLSVWHLSEMVQISDLKSTTERANSNLSWLIYIYTSTQPNKQQQKSTYSVCVKYMRIYNNNYYSRTSFS
jgi:hypothetical protein